DQSLRTEDEGADRRRSEGKDEADETLGQPRQRQATPEQQRAEPGAVALHRKHQAEEGDGEPESEQGVSGEKSSEEEWARRRREDERGQGRGGTPEELVREEERDDGGGDIGGRAGQAGHHFLLAEKPIGDGDRPGQEGKLLLVTGPR